MFIVGELDFPYSYNYDSITEQLNSKFNSIEPFCEGYRLNVKPWSTCNINTNTANVDSRNASFLFSQKTTNISSISDLFSLSTPIHDSLINLKLLTVALSFSFNLWCHSRWCLVMLFFSYWSKMERNSSRDLIFFRNKGHFLAELGRGLRDKAWTHVSH